MLFDPTRCTLSSPVLELAATGDDTMPEQPSLFNHCPLRFGYRLFSIVLYVAKNIGAAPLNRVALFQFN